jgi:hypothetical protein
MKSSQYNSWLTNEKRGCQNVTHFLVDVKTWRYIMAQTLYVFIFLQVVLLKFMKFDTRKFLVSYFAFCDKIFIFASVPGNYIQRLMRYVYRTSYDNNWEQALYLFELEK